MIHDLFLSPGHNFFGHHVQPPDKTPLIEIPEIRCVAGRGIEGDRFFDFKENYAAQISFFSSEVFDELCVSLRVRGKSPGAARRSSRAHIDRWNFEREFMNHSAVILAGGNRSAWVATRPC
jgi:hypothetical protein